MNKASVYGVTGLVVGVGLGFLICRSVLIRKYEDMLDTEVALTKEYYSNLVPDVREVFLPDSAKKPDVIVIEPDTDSSEALVERLNYQRISSDEPDEPVITQTKKSIFDNDDEEQDIGEEIENDKFDEMPEPDPDNPYIIPVSEWHEEWVGPVRYEKVSFTFYEEDDTLIDEANNVISNVDELVGKANLARFGFGSDDEDLVFVRNQILETDFSIERDTGSYALKILGLKPEYIHPEEPRRNKKRTDE